MYEYDQNNQNQQNNEGFDNRTGSVQNSYSAMRSDGTNPYQTQAPVEAPVKKKRHLLPKIAAAVAAVMLVSYGSIQCYQFLDGNKTFQAFFAKDSTSSGSSSVKDASSAKSEASAEPVAKKEYAGESWLTTLERGNAMSTTEIVDKAMPSVVGVSSTFKWEQQYSSWFGGMGQTQEQNATGTGTGIIMTADGYVITNAHVIYGAEYGGKAAEVSVMLSKEADAEETEYPATIIGYDVEADLAVLKIQADSLKPAEFGDSDSLQVGELALAIGNPLGFELFGSVTCGIVSALNREVTINDNTMNLIQTDAAINSGNSGGPLINGSGQVVGINSAKLSSSYSETTIEGLGFAIPISEAKDIINDLINYGYVTGKPQIGITAADVGESASRMYNMPLGIYVRDVTKGGAADLAGLKPGDVIIAVNGETVKTYDELNAIKDKFTVGDTLKLTITRSGSDMDVDVVLQEKQPTGDTGASKNETE